MSRKESKAVEEISVFPSSSRRVRKPYEASTLRMFIMWLAATYGKMNKKKVNR